MSQKAIDILKGFREDLHTTYKDEVMTPALITMINQALFELENPWKRLDQSRPEDDQVCIFAEWAEEQRRFVHWHIGKMNDAGYLPLTHYLVIPSNAKL